MKNFEFEPTKRFWFFEDFVQIALENSFSLQKAAQPQNKRFY